MVRRAKRLWWLLPVGIGFCLTLLLRGGDFAAAETATQEQRSAEKHRSPLALAVSPEGRYAVTANHTADSISLVDLRSGKVLTEHRCGNRPADVFWTKEGPILVSLSGEDALALLSFDKESESLKTEGTIAVGDEPRGIAVFQRTAYVAVSGRDEVAVVDLSAGKIKRRISVGGLPESVSVSPDGRWLVTCCAVPGEVYVHEAGSGELLSRRAVFDNAFNPGRGVITADSASIIFPHQVNRTFPVSEDNVEKGWAIDNRLTRLPLPEGKYWEQKQIGLDVRGDAAGDPAAVALSPDERWLAVCCGGSRELLIFDHRRTAWPQADPGDFIPYDVETTGGVFRRLELGGRPVDAEFLDENRAVVANYFLNALQIVDVTGGKLQETISLGGPVEPGLARRGEMIFHDADRSFDSWFSCASCHTAGHTCGQTFDTLNDNNYDTYKLTPSLRGVVHTAPWTWHGWQESLAAAIKKSMRSTLHSKIKVSDEDVQALLAYLETLEPPRSPYRRADGGLTEAAQRGRVLFRGKAGCRDCHAGTHFTTPETYEVGLESSRYFYGEFNPPSLRSVFSRRRFLHDGRAESLKEVLTRHHQPEKLNGEKLTESEFKDLIAYLKSL